MGYAMLHPSYNQRLIHKVSKKHQKFKTTIKCDNPFICIFIPYIYIVN